MDDVTTYYLLHRHDFGMNDAPSGACILYAISCNLSNRLLTDQFDILAFCGGSAIIEHEEDEDSDEESEESDSEPEEGSRSKVRLKAWNQRKKKSMGFEAPGNRQIPLIDQIHRLMQIWKVGDVVKVEEYLDQRVLRTSKIFNQLLQALIELSDTGSEERSFSKA